MTAAGARAYPAIMFRRLLSLLLVAALFGATGQSAGNAAGLARSGAAGMAMPAADCMRMMMQAQAQATAAHRPAAHQMTALRHRPCTPLDCLNHMIADAGMAALLTDGPAARPLVYAPAVRRRPGAGDRLVGRAPPPAIQPPIA